MIKPLLLTAIGVGSLLGLANTGPAGVGTAQHCRAPIGPATELVRDFWLCESFHSGQRQLFACRDYQSDGIRYRVYYRGGTIPKAVARVEQDEAGERLGWSAYEADAGPLCDTAPPAQIPESSHHIGTGVCESTSGQSTPCSAFEDASASQSHVIHYMVFYDKDGNGIEAIEPLSVRPNDGALVARLAFMIGAELANTDCCRQRALDYLAYSFEKYPDSDAYRKEYEWQRLEQEAFRNQDTCIGTGTVN